NAEESAAELKIANRSLMTFRKTLLGETPVLRAKRAEAVIREVLDGTDELQVKLDPIQDSYLVLLGDRRAFIVSPKDLGPTDDTVRQAADAAADRLRQVVTETQQARSLRFLMTAAGLSLLATVLYIVLLRGITYVH